jgi:putative glycosyltransferase (TIGR04372 family)
MDYLFVRAWRPHVLLADVHSSPDGDGIGYGMMLIRMRRALLVGRTMHAQVLFVRPRQALNAAVMQLQSDDVDIIAPASWRARWLSCVWVAAAPFRVGGTWLWAQRSIARGILEPIYRSVERSERFPRRLRRLVLSQRPTLLRLKAANAAYAARAEASWRTLYKLALSRVSALDRSEKGAPLVRLRFSADRERAVTDEAVALGISPDAPLVTVHVRESGYRSTAGLRQRSWDEARNADIGTYVPALKALVKRGYTVVRLGDRTMTPIAVRGVIDLATSAARTDWLEVWCTMRSEFLIGCDSGPSWLAVLLGVPILTVNAVHFRDMSRAHDRILCKLARDRTTHEVLSISEMLTEDYLRAGFKDGRYEYVDNSPSEIRQAVIDMIEVVRGRERRSSWQDKFNRRLSEIGRRPLHTRSALDGVAIMGRARGTLSRGFAKTHFVRPAVRAAGQTEDRG